MSNEPMRALMVYRGSAYKHVALYNVPTDRGTLPDALLIGWAMAKENEDPGRLFGWSVVSRTPADDGSPHETVVVSLSTD